MSHSIEELFAEIGEMGWLVNNLYQLDDGSWRANIRRGQWFTQFGKGDSPMEAMSEAMDKMSSAEESKEEAQTKVYDGPEIPTEVKINMSQIMSRLVPKITRRI